MRTRLVAVATSSGKATFAMTFWSLAANDDYPTPSGPGSNSVKYSWQLGYDLTLARCCWPEAANRLLSFYRRKDLCNGMYSDRAE